MLAWVGEPICPKSKRFSMFSSNSFWTSHPTRCVCACVCLYIDPIISSNSNVGNIISINKLHFESRFQLMSCQHVFGLSTLQLHSTSQVHPSFQHPLETINQPHFIPHTLTHSFIDFVIVKRNKYWEIKLGHQLNNKLVQKYCNFLRQRLPRKWRNTYAPTNLIKLSRRALNYVD